MKRSGDAERILELTLEIISLLSGEDYMIVRKPSDRLPPSDGPPGTQSPSPVPPPHSQKILELTHKMLSLLTGEVPVRCDDVTVYFSMEEWEYLEGHQELYRDVMMETRQPRTSPADCPAGGKSNGGGNQAAKHARKPKRRRRRGKRAKKTAAIQDCNPSTGVSAHSEHSQPEETHCAIKEEPASGEEETLRDPRASPPEETAAARVKEEDVSAADVYSHAERTWTEVSPPRLAQPDRHSRQDLSDALTSPGRALSGYAYSALREETGLYDGRNLFETPAGRALTAEVSWEPGSPHSLYPATCIKEEPQEGDSMDVSSHAKHAQTGYTSPRVKEEARSREGDITAGSEHSIATKAAYIRGCHRANGALQKRSKTFVSAQGQDYPPQEIPQLGYKCPACEKCFTSSSGLEKHQTVHGGKKFSCPQCGKLFFYKSSLVIHQRIHTGEKLFACPVCGKCFTNNSNLVVHQRIHTGEKPFACSECGKRFGHKGHLNRHARIHGGERRGVGCYLNDGEWMRHNVACWSQKLQDANPYCPADRSL